MSEDRHVPYLMTTSLRKILDAFRGEDITVLSGKRKTEADKEVNEFSEVGLEIVERVSTQMIIDWNGSPVWENRLISIIESHSGAHDISVDRMRLRVDADEDIAENLQGEWYDSGGRPFEIKEIPKDDEIYLDLESTKPDFNISKKKVDNNNTWEEYWNRLNKCEVCGSILCEHGFEHRLFEVVNLQTRSIRDNVKRGRRPKIEYDRSDISGWINEKILQPTELTSPNGQKYMRLGTHQEWVVESV